MSEFKTYVYKEGSYSIGEMPYSNYLDGYGYTYWPENDVYGMGYWKNGHYDGWMCSTGDDEGHPDKLYFNHWSDGKMVDGISLSSDEDMILIDQTTDEGKYEGYKFIIWKDGCWRYQYRDSSNETRAVEYFDDGHIEMVYREGDKSTWRKQICKNIMEGDFAVDFHYFRQATNPNVEFILGANYVDPSNNAEGPSMFHDTKKDEMNIGYVRNGKYNGILYTDLDGGVSITQYKNGNPDGGLFSVNKETYNWKYCYFKNGHIAPIRVYWFADEATLEVRRYSYTDSNLCDIISITKDFNVAYIKEYDENERKSQDSEYVDYEEVYNSTDEEVEESNDEPEEVEAEKPKTKRVKVTPKKRPGQKTTKAKKVKKVSAEDSDDDWADKLKNYLNNIKAKWKHLVFNL